MRTKPLNIADNLVHTYSVVARDPYTGQLGVAVQSHFFSVGSIVPWAEAGVGAIATQAFANEDYGPEGLALMREGWNAEQVLETLLKGDEEREIRQIAMVDAQGSIAVHTGNKCIPAAGHVTGENFSVQANLMVNDSVWPAMKRAYEEASGDLVDHMIAALEAAQAAGGDLRGQQAAALLIVSGERQKKPWQGRLFDLRVDDHPRPIEELKRLVSIRKAWLLFEKSNELAHAQHIYEALSVLKQALALQPNLTELTFRSTEILFMAGQPQEALAAFREVFSKEPAWAEMLSRLAKAGLLPNDPTFLKYILDQRT
ncbi:MAG TPA: DUF1028 domain-containing protein [Ktedonobacteraceae bacterium]|nr:DUF1028 domain-containing protein [Ktedonobacteraceae bacterium]